MGIRKGLNDHRSAEAFNNLDDFLSELDEHLSEVVGELRYATEENALELCKKYAETLDAFYQAL